MSIQKKIGFIGAYSIPFFILLSFYLDGPYWAFMPAIYTYFFVPILDEIIGKDAQNVQKEEFEGLIKDKYFDFLVYSHVWIHFFVLLFVTVQISSHNFSNIQILGFVLSQGIYASSIINVSHELGHRNHPLAIIHARLALMSVCYHHFIVEHNRGHHVHVATPNDPATSKKDQTVFEFWIQTLIGSFKSAWNIEKRLLQKKKIKTWSVKNEVLQGVFGSLTIALFLFAIVSLYRNDFTWIVLIHFFGQSLVAILSLECVNYIEHYGIVRNEISEGKYEKVNPLHSWNANHFYSNLLLFHLQRHSDHHAYASRPYQVLRHFDESPQLPFGYPVMILISLFPPLWFRVMNPKLEQWKSKAIDSEQIKNIVRQFA